jgi:lipid-A-disaccharide synthase-like uncharacterized protein
MNFFQHILTPLALFGFVGQAAFSARFLVQWLASEKAKRSVVPLAFWWLSLLGGVILFTYAIIRKDPVITVGQGFGLLVYTRNLVLSYRHTDPGLEP